MDIAKAFNSHFTNITKKYLPDNQQKPTPNLSHIQEFVASRVSPNNIFNIPLITEQEIQKFLTKLDITKATGLDNIEANFLKVTGPCITKTLMEICNLSITSNTFPCSWKVARVSPLYKKNNKDNPSNFRPVSILSILSKLLERHVANHLFEFLNSHDLLATKQSGFRPKHSCETAALHPMVDDCINRTFESEVVGVL